MEYLRKFIGGALIFTGMAGVLSCSSEHKNEQNYCRLEQRCEKLESENNKLKDEINEHKIIQNKNSLENAGTVTFDEIVLAASKRWTSFAQAYEKMNEKEKNNFLRFYREPNFLGSDDLKLKERYDEFHISEKDRKKIEEIFPWKIYWNDKNSPERRIAFFIYDVLSGVHIRRQK